MSATLRDPTWPRHFHRCQMQTLGAHVLHVGRMPHDKRATNLGIVLVVREERLVRQCSRCKRIVVKVRRFIAHERGQKWKRRLRKTKLWPMT